jgi:hypothetical protein
LVRTIPSCCTTSERLGRAMLRVVQGRTYKSGQPMVDEAGGVSRIAA